MSDSYADHPLWGYLPPKGKDMETVNRSSANEKDFSPQVKQELWLHSKFEEYYELSGCEGNRDKLIDYLILEIERLKK